MFKRSALLWLAVLGCSGDSPADQPPVLDSPEITVSVPEDGTVTIDATASDPEAKSLQYTTTAPAHGTLTGDGPIYTYAPATDYVGSDALIVTVSDGRNATQVTVRIMVGQVNDAPVAEDIALETTERQGATARLQATDKDSPALRYEIVTPPAHGTLSGRAPNLTYTPTGFYFGPDSFTYRASDGQLSSNVATATIAVADIITCGDGVQEGSEQCDDGNLSNTDACLNTCVTATCGDSFVQANVEQCDDGNESNTDHCLDTCVVASCGDGFVEQDVEECDDSNASNTDACLNTCVAATCGDTFVQAGVEQCDDGNDSNTDACLNSCEAATCGDGFTQAGVEQCDDGNNVNTDACLNTCVAAACGDGFTRAGVEQCDDGNNSNTDACLNTCVAAACGDGFTRAGVEQCDDGNNVNSDACLNTCVAATCGDGFVQTGTETCDDGNQVNTDACLNTCQLASCGDGFVQTGVEECDLGPANSTSGACVPTCKNARCGDGFTHTGVEDCDDGNIDNDDACTNKCEAPTCGDGLVQFSLGEECDDGNTISGDGCDATCLAEAYTTTTPVLLTGLLNCNTGLPTTGERVAVDSDGRIYALAMCGTSVFLMMSTDRGQTFSAPFDVTFDAASSTELVATNAVIGVGEVGTVYVALRLSSGAVVLTISSDFGATFGPITPIGVAGGAASLSLQAFNDDLFIAFPSSNTTTLVLHSGDQGATFDPGVTLNTQSSALVYGVFDVRLKTYAILTSSPIFQLQISSDLAKTFASTVSPPGLEASADWAAANGQIYGAGITQPLISDSTILYIIPTSAPTTDTQISGLPSIHNQNARNLAADAAGNVYIASVLDNNAMRVDRLAFGSLSFDAVPLSLAATVSAPNMAPLPGSGGVALIYTMGTGVWAKVVTFPIAD